MKINSFEIERFGLWSELNVPKLSGGINVFYGANEAGKSTILEFVRTQLYGFTGERKRFAQKPVFGGSVLNPEAVYQISGGHLVLETPSGQYKLRRMYYPEAQGNEDQVELQGVDGEKQGTQLLRVLVAGVDEPTFNNVFAIGLDELQKLATLSDTDAAEMLFRLSVGVERISIVEAIKELTARRNKIIALDETESKPAKLSLLLQEREKIVEALSFAKQLVRQYVQLRNEQRIAERSIENLQGDLARWEKEKRIYEITVASQPIWQRRNTLRETLDAMGQVTVVGDDVMTQLNTLTSRLTERKAHWEQVKATFQKTKDELSALKPNPKVQQLAPRIELLLEEKERLFDLNAEVEKLNAEITDINAKIAEEEQKRSVNISANAGTSARTASNVPSLNDYRSYARAVNKANQRLQRTKEQFADLSQRSKSLTEKIKGETARRDVKDIQEAITTASETVTQLKRRQTLGQKAAELAIRHKEMRRINAFLIQNQALPPWMLGLMIVAGILGAVGIGIGVYPSAFGLDSNLAPIAVVCGCLIIGGSMASKIFSEKNNTKKLEANQRQLGILTQQLERLNQEITAIDQRHPSVGTATIELRLQEALQEAAYLEKLVPVDAQRRQSSQRLKQLEVRLEHCQDTQKESAQRWKEYLQNVGLPGDWTPARIRDYLAHCDTVGELKSELEKRLDLRNQRVLDGNVLTGKIEKTAEEIGIPVSEDSSYADLFVKFQQLLNKKASDENRRKDIINKLKTQLRPMQKKVAGELRKTKQELRDLLNSFGVKKTDDLKALYLRHIEHRKLVQQKQSVQRELDAALGNYTTEEEIGKRVFSPNLEESGQSAVKNIQSISGKLHDELETRGQLSEQMKRIAEDKSAAIYQRKLAVVEEKIRQAKRQWQVYAVCSKMLDEIRISYERDRQPRTLAEASELLKLLTSGKYSRIWTPLGEETLLVDDENGNTFEVAWLSRGTREQLFIAIRLALASEFARHGSLLPIILDDVLVNFDSTRSLAAAQLLLSLAETNRQIFLFTCHEHVCRMFQKLDVPVMILPIADGQAAGETKKHNLRVLLPLSVLERRRKKRLRQQKRLQREQEEQRLTAELAEREEAIRLDAVRRAEVQRLILQMQQQATADKAFDADKKKEE